MPVCMTPAITNRLQDSIELIAWVDGCFGADGNLGLPASHRSRMAGACLRVALEHHRAIVLLVQRRFHSSALALVRLQWEAYVRGAWLAFCASDDELDRFGRETLDRSFGLFIADLEKLEAFSNGVLSSVKTSAWKTLNSLTHTGWQQISRHNTPTEIDDNHAEVDILYALNSTGASAILSIIALAAVANDQALALRACEKAKEFSIDTEDEQSASER